MCGTEFGAPIQRLVDLCSFIASWPDLRSVLQGYWTKTSVRIIKRYREALSMSLEYSMTG
jgi:hypothetical protein